MKKILMTMIATATIFTTSAFAELYNWTFQTSDVPSVSKSTLNKDTYIASEPAGLKMFLAKGGEYNLIDSSKNCGEAQKAVGGTKGCVQPKKNTVLTTKVKGPFVARMVVSGTGSAAKVGRHAFIKIADKEYINPDWTDKVPGSGENPAAFLLEANYAGTDEVEVIFGGTDIIAIWNASIETK